MPDDASLAAILCDSHYNWFEFVERVEEDSGSDLAIPSTLEKFFLQTPFLEFSQRELELIVQSHRAFTAATSACYEQERMARSINGEIVSESESEYPEQYVGVKSVTSEAGKTLVQKKQIAIKRRARRRHFLTNVSI